MVASSRSGAVQSDVKSHDVAEWCFDVDVGPILYPVAPRKPEPPCRNHYMIMVYQQDNVDATSLPPPVCHTRLKCGWETRSIDFFSIILTCARYSMLCQDQCFPALHLLAPSQYSVHGWIKSCLPAQQRSLEDCGLLLYSEAKRHPFIMNTLSLGSERVTKPQPAGSVSNGRLGSSKLL
jgi:hypothetical protein